MHPSRFYMLSMLFHAWFLLNTEMHRGRQWQNLLGKPWGRIFIHLSICSSIHPFIHPSLRPSLYPSVPPSPIYLLIAPSFHPPLYHPSNKSLLNVLFTWPYICLAMEIQRWDKDPRSLSLGTVCSGMVSEEVTRRACNGKYTMFSSQTWCLLTSSLQ